MEIPLIGLTTYRTESKSGLPIAATAEAYIRSITQAGGCPILIPPGLPEGALALLFSRLDGMLFTGGGDIDPVHYSAGDHPKVSEVDPDRDRMELYLLNKSVQEDKPFLGICRGLQLVNVGLGGTLYADILEQAPGAGQHDYYPGWPREHLAHPVHVSPGSRLASILGGREAQVNSFHHQAVEKLAPGLVPTASAPDGILEALELPGHSFGLAVQWHPEWLTTHAPMQALFEAFVNAAGKGENTSSVVRDE
jgi:putative glutamine amidotransferase